jgi:hypothetical protein
MQVWARWQNCLEQSEPIGRSDEDAGATVIQNESDLLRLEQRIQWNEHAASRSRAEYRSDCFNTLFEIYRNPVATPQSESKEVVCG